MSKHIADSRIQKSLKKPPKLVNNYIIEDLDEHIEYVDSMLDYHHATSAVNCKLFVLTLKGVVMTWYKTLSDDSINLWKKRCDEFTA